MFTAIALKKYSWALVKVLVTASLTHVEWEGGGREGERERKIEGAEKVNMKDYNKPDY